MYYNGAKYNNIQFEGNMSYNELKQHGTEDFPIELYHIEQGHTRYEMSAHWHNEIEIIRVLDGILNIRLNNNFYSVGKGEIIFINPETVHQASPENCVYECVVFHLDFISAQHGRSLPFIDSLRNHESMVDDIISVEQAENSIMLHNFEPDPDKKYALVFGNEVKGVSQDVVDMSDSVLEIPQFGTKHSLNISVSAGAVLWECCKKLKLV